jgi:hypothetical protein
MITVVTKERVMTVLLNNITNEKAKQEQIRDQNAVVLYNQIMVFTFFYGFHKPPIEHIIQTNAS